MYIVYKNHPNFYLNVVQRNCPIVEFRTQILSTIFNDTTSQGQQQKYKINKIESFNSLVSAAV